MGIHIRIYISIQVGILFADDLAIGPEGPFKEFSNPIIDLGVLAHLLPHLQILQYLLGLRIFGLPLKVLPGHVLNEHGGGCQLIGKFLLSRFVCVFCFFLILRSHFVIGLQLGGVPQLGMDALVGIHALLA